MRDVRRILGGTVSSGGQEKEWMGCLLDDLRAFGVKTDHWATAFQDEGEWHRTAKQGAEFFLTRWNAAERARAALRHAVLSPNVTGRTKERVAQSKRARTVVCSPLLTSHSGANSYFLGGGISATLRHISDVACSCFCSGFFVSCSVAPLLFLLHSLN